MYKVAVMGCRDNIYGMAAIGIHPFPVDKNDKNAAEVLKNLVDSGEYAAIYITEELAARLEHEIDHYSERVLPAIILIPGTYGNTGKGIQAIKRSVEKAVGSDIIFGDN